MILTLMDETTAPLFRQNGRFMLTYAELYAPVLGLGSCWAGWAEAAAISGDPGILEVLNLPPGRIVTGADRGRNPPLPAQADSCPASPGSFLGRLKAGSAAEKSPCRLKNPVDRAKLIGFTGFNTISQR